MLDNSPVISPETSLFLKQDIHLPTSSPRVEPKRKLLYDLLPAESKKIDTPQKNK